MSLWTLLVVITTLGGVPSGVVTIDHNTKKSCEVAGEEIRKRLADNAFTVIYACVEK